MNTILLDTHIFMWWVERPERLKDNIKTFIADTDIIYISSITSYEIYTKKALGKLDISFDVQKTILKEGFYHLPYTHEHAEILPLLPLLHRDPFDRMLITQAMREKCPLVTADKAIWAYNEIEIIKA
ncbi:MAG: type II toxin-antitoxin system VapC family toxin [Bdellovibrionales bacterium]